MRNILSVLWFDSILFSHFFLSLDGIFFYCCRCQVVGNFTVLVLPLTHAWNILQKRMFLFKCRFARMMRKNCMCIELELGLHFERSNQSIAESIPNTVQSEEMPNIYILFPKMFTIKWTEFSSCPIIFSMVVMRCVWVVLYPQKCGCFEQFVRIKLRKTKFHRDFSRNLFRLFSLFSMKKHASSCKENSWVREKTCD